MANHSTIAPSALDQYRSASTDTSTTKAKKSQLGQQDFLNLMVTQLKNQDPSNPMDGANFLGQLAQFSTVNGINGLEKTFTSLASSLQSNQALQASTMVGRNVVVPRDSFTIAAGGSAPLAATVPSAATKLMVTISDTQGQVVKRTTLGPHPAGTANFTWDGVGDNGKDRAAGTYKVRFDAVIDGHVQALTSAVSARVDSVSLGRNGLLPTLNVNGIGPVAISDVIEIQ